MSPDGRAALRRINRDIDRRSIAALVKLGMSTEEARAHLGIPEPVTLGDVWERLRELFEPISEALRAFARPPSDVVEIRDGNHQIVRTDIVQRGDRR